MDVIFNMYKIKYTDMTKLLTGYPNGSIQIFINLEPVLRRLYRSDIESYLKANRQLRTHEFVSNILNLAAHYRKYFSSQGRDTEVIMYMPDWKNSYTNSLLIKGYRDNTDLMLFNDTTVYSKFLKESVDLLDTIVMYIEGVYLIRTSTIEPSLIPLVMKNHYRNQLLITTDRYEYQYVNKDYTILRPRKGSQSYVITQHNVIEVMKEEDKILSSETMSPGFIPFALSFMGDTVRGIPKVKGVGLFRIMKLLEKAIEEGIITENTTNLSLLENVVIDDVKEQVINNFTCIDLNLQSNTIGKSVLFQLEEQKQDKFDNVSLKKLNQMFLGSPIMLNELMPAKERLSVFQVTKK